MTFVDSNVLIDIFTSDPRWLAWSTTALALGSTKSELIVNPIVIGELASGFPDLATLIVALERFEIAVVQLDEPTAFVAGQRFAAYRRGQPDRASIPADFLIGAHAMVTGASLLTRDAKVYRRYFPELELITPEADAR